MEPNCKYFLLPKILLNKYLFSIITIFPFSQQ